MTKRAQFTCNGCGTEELLPDEHVPDDWVTVSVFDFQGGGIGDGYNLCSSCAPRFREQMDSCDSFPKAGPKR